MFIRWLAFVVVYVELLDKLFNNQDWMKICHKVLAIMFVVYHSSLSLELNLHTIVAPFSEVKNAFLDQKF